MSREKILSTLACCFSVLSLLACKKENSCTVETLLFDSIPQIRPITPLIDEISGIADSKVNNGFLWGHEDSGNQPELFLFNHNGTLQKRIYIKGAVNRDWEDMAISGTYIYIGDIGDNARTHTEYRIYRFPEPSSSTDTVRVTDTIRFKYPDGSHDAEAFLVDPSSGDIYIITKMDNPSRVYRLPAQSTGQVTELVFVGQLKYGGVVSAALAPSGKEILVKTYTGLNLYSIGNGETIPQAILRTSKAIPYKIEPQGEAVTYMNDNSGFFTLSEKGFSSGVNLYYYKRK